MPGNVMSLVCPVCGDNCQEGWPNMDTSGCFRKHMSEKHGAKCCTPEERAAGDIDCPLCGEVVTKESREEASEEMREHFRTKHKDEPEVKRAMEEQKAK